MRRDIEDARAVGLRLLRASERDVERGLALHADALVCDAYGFAPRAALDADALAAAAREGASVAELATMRENMSLTRMATDPAEREEFVAAWDAAGVTCIFQNAGQESASPMIVMKRLAHLTYAADLLRDVAFRAATPDDIVAAARQNKHCFYMTTNAVPLAQQWVSVQEELTYIRIFFQLGVRMMHLTYNRRNMIGDGCGEPANAGLSDFGRAVVAEMNRVGVIVDVAHSGGRTSLEAARLSERPMVASHTGCAALNPHFRCKPDEVIRAIAETGGFVGICAVPGFLGGAGDINALLDHVDYVAKRVGTDHVAIGTDVFTLSSRCAASSDKAPEPRPAREPWHALWPNRDFSAPQWRRPDQVRSLAFTNWPLFTVGLVQRGYSDDDIRNIIGGNALRVARAVWDGRDAGAG